jgi:hypothetical protein
MSLSLVCEELFAVFSVLLFLMTWNEYSLVIARGNGKEGCETRMKRLQVAHKVTYSNSTGLGFVIA